MNRIIEADLFRHGGLKGTRGLLRGLSYPAFRFTYFLRKASFNNKRSLAGIFYRLMVRRYSHKFGYQIPVTTKIGEGLYIGHFGTIVINAHTTIGKYCNLAHGVTIGRTNKGQKKGVPVIGDYVWIGTGAVIVGGITIGDKVLIAPNAYVNFDVPSHSIVIGNPAKIISREDAVEDYINYILP